jgi:hypothetical protein
LINCDVVDFGGGRDQELRHEFVELLYYVSEKDIQNNVQKGAERKIYETL